MNRTQLFRCEAVCVVAYALASGIAMAQEPPMTVDQAVQEGLARNPQVAAGLAGVESQNANYRSLTGLPPITFGATHVQGTSTAPTLNGTNNDTFIDLGETIDLSGQRRYAAAGANATYRATQFQFVESLLSLEQQIRDAYWTLAAAQAQSRIAETGLMEAERVHDLTVRQEEAGSAPRGDVIRSSIDVANAKQTLLAAQGSERTALIAFNTLLARPAATPETLAVDLAGQDSAPPSFPLPNQSEMDKEALANRPLLKSAVEQSNAAKFAVRQAEAARLPDLSVDYQRSTTQRIDTFLFGVSFPLLDFGSVGQSIRAARETRKQVDAQQSQTRQQVLQQTSQARADLDNAIQSAAGYKREILDPSVTLLGMAQLGYQQGATGILPVIDAESTIRNARVGYVAALLAVYKAEDEVIAAIGHEFSPQISHMALGRAKL